MTLNHGHTDCYIPRHKRGHGLQHKLRIKWPKADSSEATFWNHQESNECLTKWPQSLRESGCSERMNVKSSKKKEKEDDDIRLGTRIGNSADSTKLLPTASFLLHFVCCYIDSPSLPPLFNITITAFSFPSTASGAFLACCYMLFFPRTSRSSEEDIHTNLIPDILNDVLAPGQTLNETTSADSGHVR